MRHKLLVTILVLITAAYCWGLGWIAWGFLRAGGVVGSGLAVGVVILLALTVWVTWREVLFGVAAGRLARDYRPQADSRDTAGPVGADDDGATGAGDVRDGRAEFEAARSAIRDEDQETWQAWFRLALAYDALHDRRHARSATRRAIEIRRRA